LLRRWYGPLCLGVLCDVLAGREVHFEMNCKHPLRDFGLTASDACEKPRLSAHDPEVWKPATRNHAAFKRSAITEITFTTVRPLAFFEKGEKNDEL